MVENPPAEISMSLQQFRSDFPNSRRVAFILMRSGEAQIYGLILDAIQIVLQSKGITGIRADQKHYHPDQYWNIMTYIHGCEFGIALFEDFENQGFDPNLTLGVGYMQGLGKEVCLLSDSGLNGCLAHLDSKSHRTFDGGNPHATVSQAVLGWLLDRKLGSDGVL